MKPTESDIAKARELFAACDHLDPQTQIRFMAQALAEARAEEREACEQAMKDIEIHSDDGSWYCDDSPSAAIRARGGK